MTLAIYCAGALGREVYELALDINDASRRWDEIIFVEDTIAPHENLRCRYITFDEFCKNYTSSQAEVAIAIGEPSHRKALREKVKAKGYNLAVMVHPLARVSRFAKLDEGVIICYGCNVSTESHLKTNVFLQPSCSAAHDVVIEPDSVISAVARIAGSTHIGTGVYIGMSALIRESISIGDNTIVAMGSVVQKPLPEEVIAMGNPARIIQKNTDHRVFK